MKRGEAFKEESCLVNTEMRINNKRLNLIVLEFAKAPPCKNPFHFDGPAARIADEFTGAFDFLDRFIHTKKIETEF